MNQAKISTYLLNRKIDRCTNYVSVIHIVKYEDRKRLGNDIQSYVFFEC